MAQLQGSRASSPHQFLQTPTGCSPSCQQWPFLLTNADSSISTVWPGPPICSGCLIKHSVKCPRHSSSSSRWLLKPSYTHASKMQWMPACRRTSTVSPGPVLQLAVCSKKAPMPDGDISLAIPILAPAPQTLHGLCVANSPCCRIHAIVSSTVDVALCSSLKFKLDTLGKRAALAIALIILHKRYVLRKYKRNMSVAAENK